MSNITARLQQLTNTKKMFESQIVASLRKGEKVTGVSSALRRVKREIVAERARLERRRVPVSQIQAAIG